MPTRAGAPQGTEFHPSSAGAPVPAVGLAGLAVTGAGLLLGGLAVAARRRRRRP